MTENALEAPEDPAGEIAEACTTWWGRPAGGREVLNVAFPLVVSSLSWTIMTFVDRVLLKWESGDAMAAAFASGAFWFSTLCLPLGITMYTGTFVSQYFGAHRRERIGVAMWQGVWVSLLVSPLLLGAIFVAPALFGLADHATAVRQQEILYFQVLCWGSPAMLIAQALASFYNGRGQTRVVMVVDSSAAVVNLVLDWCWIFGHFGFPALGIAGAAWATVVALWVKALVYFVLVMQPSHRRDYGTLSGMRLDGELFRRLMYYGGPSGLQLLLDVSGFTIFIMLVGRLGNIEAEATSMAFSISTLGFMPVWGFSLATSILVGQHLGEDRDDLAARATWTSLQFALCYMVLLSILYVFTPDVFLASFFAGDRSGETRDQVYGLAVSLLRFVAAYNLLDATMMVFSSAIKGAGDTQFVLYTSMVMATSLAVLSWLAVEQLHLGVYGCWVLISVWIWSMGTVFLLRFLGGKWRSMRVIEKSPVA